MNEDKILKKLDEQGKEFETANNLPGERKKVELSPSERIKRLEDELKTIKKVLNIA